MNNLLNIVCIALSIYYVFSAPTAMSPPKSSTKLVQQIIDELRRLENLSTDQQITIDMQFLYPTNGKKNMSTKDVSCRALNSIEAVLNTTDELKLLHRGLMSFTKDVHCTTVTFGGLEAIYNLEHFIAELLQEFQEYFFTSTGPRTTGIE